MYNKKTLEGLIKQTEKLIEVSETLLNNDPTNKDSEQIKDTIELSKSQLDQYKSQLDILATAGRPALGVTKKVSLTLPEETWEWLDQQADGNRSKFMREMIQQSSENMNGQSSFDDYACLGYAFFGAERTGLRTVEIRKLLTEMKNEFDKTTPDEARDKYLFSEI